MSKQLMEKQIFCLLTLKESFGMSHEQAENLLDSLISRYNEPHRYYHNLEHIYSILDCIDQYQENILDYPILYLSVWLHDVIYNTQRHNNEELSADFGKQSLSKTSCKKDRIEKCEKLILSTKKHEPLISDFDNLILLDADLSILGMKREVYLKYSSNIRKEYSLINDETYHKGRTTVLKSLLNKPRLYLTDKMYNLYEFQARENITFELKHQDMRHL